MALPDLDLSSLRRGALVPVVALLAGLILWGTTTAYRSRVEHALAAEQQSLASLEQERRDLTSRRDAQRQFAATYQRLADEGLIGRDQRLQWVQALRDRATTLGLPYVRYSTGPERPFEAPWLVPGMSAPVMSSTMEVQVGLVHELDLFRLLDKLRSSPGLFHVRTCTLERMAREALPEPDKANLSGTCQLDWFSIPRGGSVAVAATESGDAG